MSEYQRQHLTKIAADAAVEFLLSIGDDVRKIPWFAIGAREKGSV